MYEDSSDRVIDSFTKQVRAAASFGFFCLFPLGIDRNLKIFL